MTYNDDEQEITLSSTGFRFYAFTGALGLQGAGSDNEGPPWRLVYGSDGPVDEPFTPGERREIATEMIKRWERWGEGR